MIPRFLRSSMLCLVYVGSLTLTSAPQAVKRPESQQESGIVYGGTGTDLLKRCNAVGSLKAGDRVTTLETIEVTKHSNLCWGYIAGVVDTYQGLAIAGLLKTPSMFCLPAQVDMEQLEKVVKKSLDDNPARLHEQAGALILIAMGDAFPCK